MQNSIVLSDCVRLAETFYTVRSENIVAKDDGGKLRGLSQNQICIGVATDKQNTLFLVEGTGQPTRNRTLETFCKHIKPGAILIHDEEKARAKLVEELSLDSGAYSSKNLKCLTDKDNPLNPANRRHDILKKFLNARGSFDRDKLQGYLKLFAFVANPPVEMLEKVERVIQMAFENPKLRRYRDFYGANT